MSSSWRRQSSTTSVKIMNYNRVIVGGFLTKDPDIRFTPKGTAVGTLSLAINEKYKKQDGDEKEQVTFVDITVWGKQAESCKEHLRKGHPLFVEGRLRLEQWEQDGKKRQRLEVVADRVQFIHKKPETETPDDGCPI